MKSKLNIVHTETRENILRGEADLAYYYDDFSNINNLSILVEVMYTVLEKVAEAKGRTKR